jgi:hypothetical protein
MLKRYYFTIFCFLYFLCPIHFFVIGEGNGYGLQGLFYRYQISSQGSSFIPITREIGYVTSGIIDGKSGISILFWVIGSLLFSGAFFLFLFKINQIRKKIFHLISGLIITSGICFLLSSLIQYGIFFNGPAGISILIGLPFLMYFGWLVYCDSRNNPV